MQPPSFPSTLQEFVSIWAQKYPIHGDLESKTFWMDECLLDIWESDDLIDEIKFWICSSLDIDSNLDHIVDLGLTTQVFFAVLIAYKVQNNWPLAEEHLQSYQKVLLAQVPPQKSLFHTRNAYSDSNSSDDSDPEVFILQKATKRPRTVNTSNHLQLPPVLTPTYLLTLTSSWSVLLQSLITPQEVPKPTKKELILAVKFMREVPLELAQSPIFQKAVLLSKLITTVHIITHPAYSVLYGHLWNNEDLESTYRISEQLAYITSAWIPLKTRNKWTTPLYSPIPTSGALFYSLKHFFKFFKDHPNLVPGTVHHDYIFFLTSFESFDYNFNRWLAPALLALNYQVSNLSSQNKLFNLYSQIIQQIHRLCTVKHQGSFELERCEMDNHLKVIVKCTFDFREALKSAGQQASKLRGCTKCQELPFDQHCVQYRYFPRFGPGLSEAERTRRADILAEEMKHTSVTLVPPHEQMIPKPIKAGIPIKPIYSPNSYGEQYKYSLTPLTADEDILHRCGHQLYLILDEEEDQMDPNRFHVQWGDGKVPFNFAWYGAFSQSALKFLQKVAVSTTGVKPLKRGGQFQGYHTGNMTPIGSRLASGGRELDSYGPYSGLDTSLQVSQLMLETTRKAHPALVKKIIELSKECDRLGLTGANVYNCTGYVAPGHRDKDAAPSLSVQAFLAANSQYHEFSFCHYEHLYYVVSRTNLLWSFDANFVHGTMLPSQRTLRNLNSLASSSMLHQKRGVTASNGHHLTVTRKNLKRAQENAAIRKQYQLREQYWVKLQEQLL
ncbi:hypothetical protein F5879DRAFT_991003 [Lentinula edodes]|nr:hypothetical protein F5879DRAFT_991003 [Lentinula edodes]